jgi:hypothetical protein
MLFGQVRLAIVTGLDEELGKDPDLANLEVTAAQFVILKNVLKGSARSACELCKSMDYDRGAMSRGARSRSRSPTRARPHFPKWKRASTG